jgi:hypothetical protein
MPSLLVAKFIPGFSTVAPPMAGATKAGLDEFLLYDSGGALLWAGSGIVAGVVFHRAIDRALAFLASIGSAAFAILGVALAIFVAFKWWQRRSFYKFLRMARISVEDLHTLMDEGLNPIVLDVRTGKGRALDPRRIRGAAVLDVENLDAELRDMPRDREIILYCT